MVFSSDAQRKAVMAKLRGGSRDYGMVHVRKHIRTLGKSKSSYTPSQYKEIADVTKTYAPKVASQVAKIAFPQYSPIITSVCMAYSHREEISDVVSLLNEGKTEEACNMALKATGKTAIELTCNKVVESVAKYSADEILEKSAPYREQYVQFMKQELSSIENKISDFAGGNNDK